MTIKEKIADFQSKFKDQTSTAIITAFGLVVALAWKDVILEWVNRLNPTPSNLLVTAIIVTILSIIGIGILHKWQKPKQPEKNKK